ncbi:sigma-70 family RNA polymerase sigma factor [Planococcus sp. APC 4015]|nr:sigma-70 family RNA polymerase sigma factor [Planococcus sp. APC 4015]
MGDEVDDRAEPARRPRSFDASRAFDAHGSALLGFAVNALRDRPLAEDCVQETFLRAWRSRDRFDGDRASERTWLFAIARNVITDALRARARMPRIGGDDELDSRSAAVPDPLERMQIVEGLARLSEPHREVILAVHIHGRTYQELSDATGVPVATWRTRAYHALRAMRGYLEGSEDPDVHS